MKQIVIIIVIIVVCSFSSVAQQIKNNPNSKMKDTKSLVDSTKVSGISLDSSCNKNKDSCYNRKGNGQCRIKDKFIDKDGDGINDNRCKGMGLGCQKRKRNCGGKK